MEEFKKWMQTKEADEIRDMINFNEGIYALTDSVFKAIKITWVAGNKWSNNKAKAPDYVTIYCLNCGGAFKTYSQNYCEECR